LLIAIFVKVVPVMSIWEIREHEAAEALHPVFAPAPIEVGPRQVIRP